MAKLLLLLGSSLRGGVRTAIRSFGPNIDNTASPCIKSSESASTKVQLEDEIKETGRFFSNVAALHRECVQRSRSRVLSTSGES
jgi:hypothetical protein